MGDCVLLVYILEVLLLYLVVVGVMVVIVDWD